MTLTSSENIGSRLPVDRRPIARVLKRSIDLILSLLLLILLLPLLILLAACVAVDMHRSPLFWQERVGKGGRLFRIVKFRSMRDEPTVGATKRWDATEHARVTRLGSFLRDYGLDELPQLWNIIRGDMSIIGPRPPVESELQWYPNDARVAFEMRPGVLSLAAIRGRRGIPLEERFRLHARYVREWTPMLDLRILFSVVGIILRRHNAVE